MRNSDLTPPWSIVWMLGRRLGVHRKMPRSSLPRSSSLLITLLLLVSCGGSGENEDANAATIELTGDRKESIQLTLEEDPLYEPGTEFLLRYSNEKDQSLALHGPARSGTYPTHTGGGGAALLQMQINPGAPGYSHNAFADECKVTVERAEQTAIEGHFTCDFGQTHAEGTYIAAI
jgi:hypothetical protein